MSRGIRLAGLLLIAACGGGAPAGSREPAAVEVAPAEPPPAPAPEPPPVARTRDVSIDRAALDRVLAGGPGRFLATVEVRARVAGKRFTGWEVVRTPWPELDLVPGDVVTLVNRRRLERPLELESLWTELCRATALTVAVERGAERFTLELPIVGGADGSAGPAAGAPRR